MGDSGKGCVEPAITMPGKRRPETKKARGNAYSPPAAASFFGAEGWLLLREGPTVRYLPARMRLFLRPFQDFNCCTVTPKRDAIVDNVSPWRMRYCPPAAARVEPPPIVKYLPAVMRLFRSPFQVFNWATVTLWRLAIPARLSPRRMR